MGRHHSAFAESEATLMVLALLEDADDIVAEHYNARRRSFEVAGLLAARAWSTSEQALIQTAGEIWGGRGTIGRLIGSVDDRAYSVVLNALALRRMVLVGVS